MAKGSGEKGGGAGVGGAGGRSAGGGGKFASAFSEAFAKLDSSKENYVKAHDLRMALPQFSRAEFDAGFRELQHARKFTGDVFEGRHMRATPEELASQIDQSQTKPLFWIARRT